MTKSPPRLGSSLLATTIATSIDPQDQNSIKHPAQPAYTFTRSKDSMPRSTQVNIEDLQDHTPVSSIAQSAHYQAGQDACTALSKFISFMDEPDRLQKPIHNNDYPKYRKICQEALEAATRANRSEVKTYLSQFDKAWSDLPDCIQRVNQAPDLTKEEYNEYEDLCYQMDYHRVKLEAMALNPDGCTERSKVDDSMLHGHELISELLDPAGLDFS
jgi:hypothetical protein